MNDRLKTFNEKHREEDIKAFAIALDELEYAQSNAKKYLPRDESKEVLQEYAFAIKILNKRIKGE